MYNGFNAHKEHETGLSESMKDANKTFVQFQAIVNSAAIQSYGFAEHRLFLPLPIT